MFIRRTKTRSAQRDYYSYRLVESERVGERVRQRTLLNLGNAFSVPRERWAPLVERIEQLRRGQGELVGLGLSGEEEQLAQRYAAQLLDRAQPAQPEALACDYVALDLDSLSLDRARSVGVEHAGLSMLRELGLDEALTELGFNRHQRAAAIGNIIARLCAPGSERASAGWLAKRSALGELIDYDYSAMSLNRLYHASDQLLKHKSVLQEHLFERERSLFSLTETITLYDLTNTFFEGQGKRNELARRGMSKEKRSDCPLVTLALVLDGSGFPRRSEIFEGNASEAKTLERMLTDLQPSAQATVVMDAGIATQANIDWLSERGYRYLVVSRERRRQFDPEQAESITTRSGQSVQLQRCVDDDTGEVRLYCQSPAREEKERAMQRQASERFEQGLTQLAEGLSKKTGVKRHEKVLERLGRLRERHARAAQHYQVELTRAPENDHVTAIHWQRLPVPGSQATHPGVYCLRTNRDDWDEATLWRTYTMLTDLEAVFRSLKSELGLRPVYHQTTERVRGHLFITVLAYHIVHAMRTRLKRHNIHDCWDSLRHQLANQQRVTVTLQDRQKRTHQIRKTTKAEDQERHIYEALGIHHLPGKTRKAILD
jgi:transposase